MKQLTIIISSILFGILFYGKHIGLNLSIFSLLSLAFLSIQNPKKFKEKTTILFGFIYIITAILVFIQSTGLSIIANIAAFFTLIGSLSEHKNSIYVKWLNGIYTSISGFFHRRFTEQNSYSKDKPKQSIDTLHLVKLIGIPALFIIVFILLYKNGNPNFNNLISNISFDFINVQWVLFCLLGYYLFSNISKPIQIEPLTSEDLNTSNLLIESTQIDTKSLIKEKQLGTLLLGLLSILIAFYIATDISYLLAHNATSASELSNQVHYGINTLIISIVIAILIILYFFRGDLNFYSDNRTLKNLTYLWILLNLVLVILIAIKNQNYISTYGLTYKRIGVHIYILLTLVGLFSTYVKVLNIKNLSFLFRLNTIAAFAVLILSSTINWDRAITNFNIHKAKSFDINYLINLSNRNASLLHTNKNNLDISQDNKSRIETKYNNYLKFLEQNSWQELTYHDLIVQNKASKPNEFTH